MDLLKALAKPHGKRRRDLVEWVGPGFDPDRFDRAAINRKLRAAGTPEFLRKRERFYEGL
jgi:hypothetical protein